MADRKQCFYLKLDSQEDEDDIILIVDKVCSLYEYVKDMFFRLPIKPCRHLCIGHWDYLKGQVF